MLIFIQAKILNFASDSTIHTEAYGPNLPGHQEKVLDVLMAASASLLVHSPFSQVKGSKSVIW